MTAMSIDALLTDLARLAHAFRTPTLAAELGRRLLEGGHEDALRIVHEVFSLEAEERQGRRVERLRKASRLPVGKTFDTFDDSALPRPLVQKLHQLAGGEFLDRAANGLAFGLPGTGKTHACAAIGHALVALGRSVYFTSTHRLVQQLLAAKRDLELPAALRKLDQFDLMIIDDIGYVQQDAQEIEVLFTLMAERYERRSLLISIMWNLWSSLWRSRSRDSTVARSASARTGSGGRRARR